MGRFTTGQISSEDPPVGLSGKVIRGSAYIFSLKAFAKVLGMIRLIILARLLAPEDFGIVGIAVLALAVVETFSQTGFQTALIQKNNRIEPYLDTAWTAAVLRGILLFLVLYTAAPALARFFEAPDAVAVVRVIATTSALAGFINIGIYYFQKELQFRKHFVYEISSIAAELVIAVILAFILRNYWALVGGGIAGAATRLLMSYILHPYRPKVNFNWKHFIELFRFGRWVASSNILVFAVNRGDDLFIGKFAGAASLGFYQVAFTLGNLPTTEVTSVLSQVTFPAYAKLQNDRNRVRLAYTRVLKATAMVCLPMAAFIIVLSDSFTYLFLGAQWLPIVPVVKILAVAGAIRSIGATAGPVFLSLNRPQYLTHLLMLKFSMLAVSIYPLTRIYGMTGTALAVLIAGLVTNPMTQVVVSRLLQLKTTEILSSLLLPLLVSLPAAFGMFGFEHLYPVDSLFSFASLLLVGILLISAAMIGIGPFFGHQYKDVISIFRNFFHDRYCYRNA